MPTPKSLVARILPKTLAGLAVWILLFAAGVAAAGVILFFWYNYRLELVKGDILRSIQEFDEEAEAQKKELKALADEARGEISRAAGEASSTRTGEVTELLEKVGPSIVLIQGKNGAGAPSSGSGFVVTSTQADSWIITNYHLVAGSVTEKSPVQVRSGAEVRSTTVYSWDPQADLALIILRIGGLPNLSKWSDGKLEVGSKVWAVGAAPGQYGSAASQGFLLDLTEAGILSDADVPATATGGPLLTAKNEVLGVLSTAYAPEGFAPSNGWAVPIRMSCRRVLRCPG